MKNHSHVNSSLFIEIKVAPDHVSWRMMKKDTVQLWDFLLFYSQEDTNVITLLTSCSPECKMLKIWCHLTYQNVSEDVRYPTGFYKDKRRTSQSLYKKHGLF